MQQAGAAEAHAAVAAAGDEPLKAAPPPPSSYLSGKPAWSESYTSCTILVARVANLRCRYAVPPESELQFLHAIKEGFDNVTVKHNHVVWKMHAFQFPYYGLCIPDVEVIRHADLAVQTALELKRSTAGLLTPDGEALDVRIGLASGPSCAGLIGSCGINFVVTGDARVLAQALADATGDIAIAEVTNSLMAQTGNNALRSHNRKRLVMICADLEAEAAYYEYAEARSAKSAAKLSPQQSAAVALLGAARAELRLGPESVVCSPVKGFTNPGLEDAFRSWHNRDMLPSDLIGGMAATIMLISSRLFHVLASSEQGALAAGVALWFLAVPFGLTLLHPRSAPPTASSGASSTSCSSC